jgi:hypothetical protein
MLRETTITTTEADVEDRSMRLVEYLLALMAAVAAGILAFVR